MFEKFIRKEEVKEGPLNIKYLVIFGMKFIRRVRMTDYISTENLNSLIDITKVRPARGRLRRLQLINLRLLRIFDAICRKHNFQYFLSEGTLLGDVRHGGFTPWDDDIDVWVRRGEYKDIARTLEEDLSGEDIRIYGIEDTRLGDATLRLSHRKLPECNLDVFYWYGHRSTSNDRAVIYEGWQKAHENYSRQYSKLRKRGESRDRVASFLIESDAFYDRALPEGLKITDEDATFVSSEISWGEFRYLPMSSIYPLGKISFEGYSFPAPHSTDVFLSEFYGDYMSFPPTLAHHGDTFRGFKDQEIALVEQDLDRILVKILSDTVR